MIISQGRGYIFVHIPKTGGTAMAMALEHRVQKDDILIGDTPKAKRRKHRLDGLESRGRLWKHSTLADIDGLVSREALEQMFVFTLVRNPWDRLVSYYHWLREQNFKHPAVGLAKRLAFEPFLRDPATVQSIRASGYTSYVTDAEGVMRCNAFVRLEHLKQDLRPVWGHLGFEQPIPRANRSRRPEDYRSAYNDELAEFVGVLCAHDVARFGYGF